MKQTRHRSFKNSKHKGDSYNLKSIVLHHQAVRMNLFNENHIHIMAQEFVLTSEAPQGFSIKIWVINKLNIITNTEFEARFPTIGTFNQQPISQAGRTHDETGAYRLEAHEDN